MPLHYPRVEFDLAQRGTPTRIVSWPLCFDFFRTTTTDKCADEAPSASNTANTSNALSEADLVENSSSDSDAEPSSGGDTSSGAISAEDRLVKVRFLG